MTKKRGRPAFPTKHRTLNVYLPNDMHDRLGKWAARLKCSRSALIRGSIGAAIDAAEYEAALKAKQQKVYGK